MKKKLGETKEIENRKRSKDENEAEKKKLGRERGLGDRY
jgi:hypothetical protein